jgi:small subunit ribosomal protein S1
MVTKAISEPDLPVPDDGWWESVLAEDDSLVVQPSRVSKEGQKAAPQVDWELAMQKFREDAIITLTVTGHNRGGLLVEGEGLAGFIPCSHLVNLPAKLEEEHRDECLSTYLGRTVNLKIIECVPDEDRIVFSERAARSAAGKRTEIFTALQPGQRVTGEVTNVTDFGAFVDLGGVEGLIHISELSWGRVAHPGQVLQVGQTIDVIVLEVSPERCRIALSLKRLLSNPWENAGVHYPVNSIVPAVITALVPFGVFARLEEGLEGLIHTSEILLPADMTIKSYFAPGQTIEVRVLQVDAPRQRLGLSMKLDEIGGKGNLTS